MRNLIRCNLRNTGPLTIAQKVNKLAPSTLFQMKNMTFFIRNIMYGENVIACYFKAFRKIGDLKNES